MNKYEEAQTDSKGRIRWVSITRKKMYPYEEIEVSDGDYH